MALRTQEGIATDNHLVQFADDRSFALFCSHATFSSCEAEPAAGAMHQVCQVGSSVAHPWVEDQRGTTQDSTEFELAAEFGAEREDPGRARRMVVAALRRKGYGDTLVQDAALVLTEMATNAVLHAGSSFSISVNSEDSMLRIAVADRDPLTVISASQKLIPRQGRGLGLIDAVSARWGTTVLAEGKIVWAELEAGRL